MEFRNIQIRNVPIAFTAGPPTPNLAPTPPTYPPGAFVGGAGATYNNLVSMPSVSGPFGGNLSPYYALSPGGYVAIAPNTNWAPGTDDFTIEWFQYGLSSGSALYPRIFTVGVFPSTSIGVSIESGTFYFWVNGGLFGLFSMSITDNTWRHIAVCRYSINNLIVYVDGVVKGVAYIGNVNISNATAQLNLFGEATDVNTTFNGYITNFRWCNGIRVYSGASTTSANFVVPTSPLTQIAAANPYGGSNTAEITSGQCKLLVP